MTRLILIFPGSDSADVQELENCFSPLPLTDEDNLAPQLENIRRTKARATEVLLARPESPLRPSEESPEQQSNSIAPPELPNTDAESPVTNKRQKAKVPQRANTRKRVSNPEIWKRNKAKANFNSGLEYTTEKGTIRKAREMKSSCHVKCNRCEKRLSEDERRDLFEKFWQLENLERKRDYISRLITDQKPATIHTSIENAKKSTRIYHLIVNDGEEAIRVCKKMFLNTLGIADSWIETTLKKMGPEGLEPDMRGRHHNRPNRISEATRQSVRDHINSYIRVYSHYTRERTKREYLETNVKSVERMYRQYQEWAPLHGVERLASDDTYREIFTTEFNLGFFMPKKDQCETCNKWKNASGQEERRLMVNDYGIHLQNKTAVNRLHKQNRLDAEKAAENGDLTTCVACFDLEKILTCPRSETSIMFYLNKVSLFNFTIFDLGPGQGHCYVWTEVDANKGPNEVGTCVLTFIIMKVGKGTKKFVFYSDAPTSQNRNRMIWSMYRHAAAKYQVDITHRYLESGHSYSEADSMHARIEQEADMKEIFTPDQWVDLMKGAKQNPPAYEVNRLENAKVLNLHHFVEKENWRLDVNKKQVYWSRVREVIKYNFSEELTEVKIKSRDGGEIDMASIQFPPVFTGRISLKENKKKDIQTMMSKRAIPSQYHHVYQDFLSI